MLRLPPHEAATRLVLVRHLEPDEGVAGRAYGALDVPLSAEAHNQAEQLAEALGAIDLAAVYSSPLRRSLETAAPIAARHGLSPVAHEGLREIDFGELEGERYEDVERGRPELFQAWMEDPTEVSFPGGESFADLRVRALAATQEILERQRGSTSVLVAHGGVIRAIIASSLEMPDRALFRLDQPYGAINVIDWFDGTPVVRLLNARPF
jgi:broad specificity phosphatase PhoE